MDQKSNNKNIGSLVFMPLGFLAHLHLSNFQNDRVRAKWFKVGLGLSTRNKSLNKSQWV